MLFHKDALLKLRNAFNLLLPSFALLGSGGVSPRPPIHTAPELSKCVVRDKLPRGADATFSCSNSKASSSVCDCDCDCDCSVERLSVNAGACAGALAGPKLAMPRTEAPGQDRKHEHERPAWLVSELRRGAAIGCWRRSWGGAA